MLFALGVAGLLAAYLQRQWLWTSIWLINRIALKNIADSE